MKLQDRQGLFWMYDVHHSFAIVSRRLYGLFFVARAMTVYVNIITMYITALTLSPYHALY